MEGAFSQPVGWMSNQNGAGVASFGNDANLYVRFFYQSEYRSFRSETEGRPIFEDVLYIEITRPGDKSNMISRASDEHKRRFPQQWQAFQQGEDQAKTGTSIEKLPGLAKSQIAELHYLKLFTIEQLTGVSDSQLQALGPGGFELRAQAQQFLSVYKNAQEAEKRAAELDVLRGELKQLRELLAGRSEKSEEKPKSRGRGRPRKVEAVAIPSVDGDSEIEEVETEIE